MSADESEPALNESVRNLFKGASLVGIGLILDLGLSFVGKVAISRHLSADDFGLLVIGTAFVTAVMRLAPLGTNMGVVRNLPRYSDAKSRREIARTAFITSIAAAIGISALTAVFAGPISQEILKQPRTEQVLRIFALIAPLGVVMRMGIALSRGDGRVLPRVAIDNVIEPVLRISLIGVVVFLGYGLLAGVYAFAIPYIVAGLLAGGLVLRRYLPPTNLLGPTRFRELLVFSLPLVVTSSMWLVIRDLDTFLIAAFSTSNRVAIYNVAYTLATLLTMPKSAVDFIGLPSLSELHAEERSEEFRRLFRTIRRWVTSVVTPMILVMILLPSQVIHSTFGPKYVGGALALQIVATGIATYAVSGLGVSVLTSIGRTRSVMWMTALAAATNLGLNLVLIPHFGTTGAAIATLASYTILDICVLTIVYLETGVVMIDWEQAALLFIGFSVFAPAVVITRSVVPLGSIMWLVPFVFVCTSVYLLGIARFVGGEEELHIIKSIEDRFDVRIPLVKSLIRA
ncbi:membrane protein [Halarchaeum acidiphilum MH1-52-1]|uniref:Membrane protein n=1 Tax=Halarchaeum acidiphilum MH1-52-1 TaxID=1261545 RepID=U2YWU7_9EURY|nr:flippase [Halarchaeum acidiphilum]GAD53515.1 membrane protein [Halarchaeum acidiphilum MH1-52-1]